jgi:hypothetical protein
MRSPRCYRFIWRKAKTEFDTIDWDRVTSALEWKYQRRWTPGQSGRSFISYRNCREVKLILNKYRDKLYVFLSPQDQADRRLRDILSSKLQK